MGKTGLFSDELITKINNVKLSDITHILDIYRELNKQFSLIPLHRLSCEPNRYNKPIHDDWIRWCHEKSSFRESDYIGNNAGITCGPASGIIVLKINDTNEFKSYMQNNLLPFDGSQTFTVESSNGHRQYFFKYPESDIEYISKKFTKRIIDNDGKTNSLCIFQIIGNNGYTLSPGSIDQDALMPSRIIRNKGIAELPGWIIKLYNKSLKIINNENLVNNAENEPDKNSASPAAKNQKITQSIDSSPQDRFKDHFDQTVGWGTEKEITKWTDKDTAFQDANYLMFPKSRRKYMCFDLDWEGAATIWMDEGLLEPTISIVNRLNGHAILAYELLVPVIWPSEHNTSRISHDAVKYFKSIRCGYNNKLDADHGYVNASIKNPFSTKWRVTWADKQYDLHYLADFVDLPSKSTFYNRIRDKAYVGRNEELFYISSQWSYNNVKSYEIQQKFHDALLVYMVEKNLTTINDHWPDRGPLNNSEVTSMARGIVNFTWPKRNSCLSNFIKNFGIMGFKPIAYDLSDIDRKYEIYNRQSLGAMYTHEQLRNGTEKKLELAINELQKEGKKINYKQLSIKTGLNYKTVLKYKEYINKIINV